MNHRITILINIQSSEYKNNYAQFVETAKEWTRKFAMSSDTPVTSTATVANTTISNTDNKTEAGDKMVVDSNKNDSKASLQKSPKSPPRKNIEIDSDSDNDFFGDDSDSSDEEIKREDKKSEKESSISPNKNSNDSVSKHTNEKTPLKEKTKEKEEKTDNNSSPKTPESTTRKPGLSLFGKSNKPGSAEKKLSLSLRKDK